MNNKFLRLGTLIIGATLIGLAPIGASAQSPRLAPHLEEPEQLALTKEIQSNQSKLILAPNSEEQTQIQLYEKASLAVVANFTRLGHGSGFIVSPDRVETDFTQAIAINLEDAEFYIKRGFLRAQMKNYQGAEADFTQAIKLNPDDAVAYINRGVTRRQLKNYQGAEADYTQAIKLNPESAEAYGNRGILRTQVKNYQGALADLQTAAQLFRKQNNIDAYEEVQQQLSQLQASPK